VHKHEEAGREIWPNTTAGKIITAYTTDVAKLSLTTLSPRFKLKQQKRMLSIQLTAHSMDYTTASPVRYSNDNRLNTKLQAYLLCGTASRKKTGILNGVENNKFV